MIGGAEVSDLEKALRENPQVIEFLSVGNLGHEFEYYRKLEDLVINNSDRRELLKLIDEHYFLTERLRMEGLLEDDETWF
jgi:hypothetical protein